MKKTLNLMLVVLLAAMGMFVSSCKSDDVVAPKSNVLATLDGIVELDPSKSEVFDRLLLYKGTLLAFKEDAFSPTKSKTTKAVNGTSYLHSSLTICPSQFNESTGEYTLEEPLMSVVFDYSRVESFGLLPSYCFFRADENYLLGMSFKTLPNNKVEVTVVDDTGTVNMGIVDMTNSLGSDYKDDPVKSALLNLNHLIYKLGNDKIPNVCINGKEISLKTSFFDALAFTLYIESADYTHSDEAAVEQLVTFSGGNAIATKVESWYGTCLLHEGYDLVLSGSYASYQRDQETYCLSGSYKIIGNKAQLDDLKKLGRFGFWVGSAHRDVYDHKYYADLDNVSENGSVEVEVSDLEPGEYISQFFFEFNDDDTGLYVPGSGTSKMKAQNGGPLYFQERTTRRFTISQFILDIKHISLVDLTSSIDPFYDCFYFVEGPWGRNKMYDPDKCAVHSDLSRLYAIYYDENDNKTDWLKSSLFEPYNEYETYDDVSPEHDTRYFKGENIDTVATNRVMLALDKLIDENKESFTDNPKDRTVVFVTTNRPFCNDETYKKVREKWSALPSSKRLIVLCKEHGKDQLVDAKKEGLVKTCDDLASWSNAKVFYRHQLTMLTFYDMGDFIIPAHK